MLALRNSNVHARHGASSKWGAGVILEMRKVITAKPSTLKGFRARVWGLGFRV